MGVELEVDRAREMARREVKGRSEKKGIIDWVTKENEKGNNGDL